MPARKIRNLIFTWNNPEEDFIDLLKSHEEISYCVCQLEEVSTLHVQGYIELHKQVSFAKVAKWFKWHIEPRMGSQSQAIEYCRKEESRKDGPWEWGERKVQGKRTDVEGMYEAIKLGKRERDIAEEMPAVHAKYFKAHDRYRSLVDYDLTKGERPLEVHVLWGKAGCGKTHKAIHDSEDYYILSQPSNGNLWFDGYQGEKTLIIDDFYGWIKFAEFLRITDKWQYRCPVKGGFTWAKWEKIFITSNSQPKDWYPNVSSDSNRWAAFERRMTSINKM